MKKTNQSSRDYQHRGNSRGQVRGQSRGQDIAKRGMPSKEYNTIQHSKNIVQTKPTAKVGNFMPNTQGRSSLGGGVP